jgi:hypothetical protein
MLEIIETLVQIDDNCAGKIKCDWCKVKVAVYRIARLDKNLFEDCFNRHHSIGDD